MKMKKEKRKNNAPEPVDSPSLVLKLSCIKKGLSIYIDNRHIYNSWTGEDIRTKHKLLCIKTKLKTT